MGNAGAMSEKERECVESIHQITCSFLWSHKGFILLFSTYAVTLTETKHTLMYKIGGITL